MEPSKSSRNLLSVPVRRSLAQEEASEAKAVATMTEAQLRRIVEKSNKAAADALAAAQARPSLARIRHQRLHRGSLSSSVIHLPSSPVGRLVGFRRPTIVGRRPSSSRRVASHELGACPCALGEQGAACPFALGEPALSALLAAPLRRQRLVREPLSRALRCRAHHG